jgi:hypothetical protein
MRVHICCVIALFLSLPLMAQQALPDIDEDGNDPYEQLSYFCYGFNYLSNNVYLGRKDTSVIPYYSPYIGYHLKDGLYAKALVSFTSDNGTHADLATLEAGWEHTFNEHFIAAINADRFIYNKNSLSIRANTKGSVGAGGQYTNDYIEPTLYVDVDFNNKSTDYVTSFMLDHDFQLADKKLNIFPAVLVNIGTQRYLDEYYVTRINKKEKTKLKKVLANANRFVPLDYELSVKTTYMTPRWLFTLIPTYAIPVNAATLTLPGNHIVTEHISNTFYLELDICHR